MYGDPPPPPGGGGRGYFHMYAYWVCAANETPIFSHEFPFRSISFSQISLISTRSSPPTATAQRVRQRRGLAAVPEIRIFKRSAAAVPEPRIFKLKTTRARSGAPHFHTRPGARSGALANCSLCRGTYTTKIWGEYPPPPPPRDAHFFFTRQFSHLGKIYRANDWRQSTQKARAGSSSREV